MLNPGPVLALDFLLLIYVKLKASSKCLVKVTLQAKIRKICQTCLNGPQVCIVSFFMFRCINGRPIFIAVGKEIKMENPRDYLNLFRVNYCILIVVYRNACCG